MSPEWFKTVFDEMTRNFTVADILAILAKVTQYTQRD